MTLGSLDCSTSVTIDCRYTSGSWFWSEKIYLCAVTSKNIFNDNHVTISGANGNHIGNNGDSNVTGIQFHTIPKIKFFPKGIENVFPNIIWIQINRGNLQSITKEDLQPFPQLKYLYLDQNEIKVLETNLFTHNPLLKVIWFRTNPIEHIDPGIFSGLSNLERLLLGKCVGGPNFGDAHGRENVLRVIRKIENKECFLGNFETVTLIPYTKCIEPEVLDAIKAENDQLKAKLEQIKEQIEESDQLREEYYAMLKNYDAVLVEKKELVEKVRKFETQVAVLAAKLSVYETN